MLIYRLVEVKRHLVGGVGESGWYSVEISDEASGEAQHADPRGGGGTRFPKFSKFHTWFGSAPPARTRTATARRACATCAANHGHLPDRQRRPARLRNLLSRCRRRGRRNRTCCTTCVSPSPGLMWTRHAVSSLGWELCCPRMIHRQPLMPACRWVILGYYCVPPQS